ncbi:ArdC-like ssDNA-binding domain-containing protein [Lutibacter sp.]|uniref:ArdC-like ssDNA-binding domain-containing protein n=1 Tax=Lutibacter sp. TaxID=1925666 RepID=UPI00356B5745
MGAQDKKEQLKLLSLQARELKQHLINKAPTLEQAEAIDSLRVNDIIIDHFYKDDNNTEFHSYKGWQELGYQVKKGSKAFLIWGRKRENISQEQASAEEKDQYKFFPLAFIFSNNQVEPIKHD